MKNSSKKAIAACGSNLLKATPQTDPIMIVGRETITMLQSMIGVPSLSFCLMYALRFPRDALKIVTNTKAMLFLDSYQKNYISKGTTTRPPPTPAAQPTPTTAMIKTLPINSLNDIGNMPLATHSQLVLSQISEDAQSLSLPHFEVASSETTVQLLVSSRLVSALLVSNIRLEEFTESAEGKSLLILKRSLPLAITEIPNKKSRRKKCDFMEDKTVRWILKLLYPCGIYCVYCCRVGFFFCFFWN